MRLSEYKRLLGYIPKEGLVLSFYDEDYETGRACLHSNTYAPKFVLSELLRNKYAPSIDELAEIKSSENLKELIACALDAELVETVEEQSKRLADDKRRKLESAARNIALEAGVDRLDSFEFIEAVERRIESERDLRYGMREDGLCIGWGVTYEQWSDDYNYSSGVESSYYDILDWLSTYCPMLWAAYQEKKRQTCE
jgi:hypothetical protein